MYQKNTVNVSRLLCFMTFSLVVHFTSAIREKRSLSEIFPRRKIEVSAAYLGTPYEDVVAVIPGVIEAEFFDVGGQDITYNNVEADADAEMPENVIRVEENDEEVGLQINDVSTEGNPDASEEAGAMAVGMGMSTEWMRYTIEVEFDGIFLPTYRIASWGGIDGGDDADNLVAVNIKVVIGTGVEVDPCVVDADYDQGLLVLEVNTGGWKMFESFPGTPIAMDAGEHVLVICLDEVINFEINSITFTEDGEDALILTDAPSTSMVTGTSSD